MDMAVASLFKHKIQLDLIEERIYFLYYDRARRIFKRLQDYRFQIIENVESISLRGLYSLYTNFYESFILYGIPKALYETRDFSIDSSSKGGHPGTLAKSVPECPPLAKIVPDCPSGGQSGTISSQFALLEGQTGTAVPDCPSRRAIWDGLPH